MVLLADIGALHGHGDDGQADAHGTAEHEALLDVILSVICSLSPLHRLERCSIELTDVLTGS
jgi:hypothetical protein